MHSKGAAASQESVNILGPSKANVSPRLTVINTSVRQVLVFVTILKE